MQIIGLIFLISQFLKIKLMWLKNCENCLTIQDYSVTYHEIYHDKMSLPILKLSKYLQNSLCLRFHILSFNFRKSLIREWHKRATACFMCKTYYLLKINIHLKMTFKLIVSIVPMFTWQSCIYLYRFW